MDEPFNLFFALNYESIKPYRPEKFTEGSLDLRPPWISAAAVLLELDEEDAPHGQEHHPIGDAAVKDRRKLETSPAGRLDRQAEELFNAGFLHDRLSR